MQFHKGFLLVELMMGLLLSILFLIIITHYIIEAHAAQQKAMEKIEAITTARNNKEREFAQK